VDWRSAPVVGWTDKGGDSLERRGLRCRGGADRHLTGPATAVGQFATLPGGQTTEPASLASVALRGPLRAAGARRLCAAREGRGNPPCRHDLRPATGSGPALTHARRRSYKPAIFAGFQPGFPFQANHRVQHPHPPPAPIDRAPRLRARRACGACAFALLLTLAGVGRRGDHA
jgi:hypothetical protein